MGKETISTIGSISPLAGAGLGLMESRKASKRAKREASTQRAHQEQQATLYRAEQAQASEKQARLQEQINKGIARGNRRRIRGGLFGDAGTPSQAPLRQTLG